MVVGLAKYAETDLLCYRVAETRLAARQAAEWQPLLDWAALQHDAPLRVTTGLMPVQQDPTALAALQRVVGGLPPLHLVALGVLVPAFGSLVLGLAVVLGRLGPEEAHALATLDERHQEEFWGTDPEAATRRVHVARDVALAARLVALTGPGTSPPLASSLA
jgi:chaperone required for assembly of F1-ATPase